MTAIGAYAFTGCNGLTGGLYIPQGITEIGGAAFYNCAGLTGDVTLPASVTSLGSSAFYNCCSLTGFRVEAGSALASALPCRVWWGCSGLEYIDLKALPASALQGRHFTRTKVPDSHPFTGVAPRTVVYLPSGVDGGGITASDSTLNYVLDGECQWLSVMEAYDYEMPHPFTARKATYNNTTTRNYREFSGTTAKTLYLPYAATLPEGMKAYTLGEMNVQKSKGTSKAFVFTSLPEGAALQPYTPYVVLVEDGLSKTFGTETDVYVPAMPAVGENDTPVQAGDWLFCGTTELIPNAEAAAMGAYNLKNNVWHPISTQNTAGHVGRFRCFLRLASATAAGTNVRKAAFFLTEGGTTTGIESASAALEQGAARIYDLHGLYLGTDFEALPQGIYIVDGKKVYKP